MPNIQNNTRKITEMIWDIRVALELEVTACKIASKAFPPSNG